MAVDIKADLGRAQRHPAVVHYSGDESGDGDRPERPCTDQNGPKQKYWSDTERSRSGNRGVCWRSRGRTTAMLGDD